VLGSRLSFGLTTFRSFGVVQGAAPSNRHRRGGMGLVLASEIVSRFESLLSTGRYGAGLLLGAQLQGFG